MMNDVSIIGNLGADAETRTTQNGTTVVTFSLAYDEFYASEKHTGWVDCTFFGKRAEGVAPYLLKGSKVGVSGGLHYETWEQDGHNRNKLTVTVRDVTLLGSKTEEKGFDDSEVPF